jgi:hypothetical protein
LKSAQKSQGQMIAWLGAFEFEQTSSITNFSFYCDLRMRDDIRYDLDDQKNKKNNPISHGIILPSH